MGKTFRRQKTDKKSFKRLNTHRDLPDYQYDLVDDPDFYVEEEEYYAKLHPKEQDVVRREDEPSGQADKR
jgi:hypothetical protein